MTSEPNLMCSETSELRSILMAKILCALYPDPLRAACGGDELAIRKSTCWVDAISPAMAAGF
jgi:hypothetical protein